MATRLEVEYAIGSYGNPEKDLSISMSLTGLTREDLLQPQEGSHLQQLMASLPQENRLRIFLENFCLLTAHIREKLLPAECNLDLATDTHLLGLEDTLAIIMRTYMSHPEDIELNTANAEQAVRQIQRSLKALRK